MAKNKIPTRHQVKDALVKLIELGIDNEVFAIPNNTISKIARYDAILDGGDSFYIQFEEGKYKFKVQISDVAVNLDKDEE